MGAIDRRIGLLFLIFLSLLFVALARATYLGSFRAAALRHYAANQQVTDVTVPAERGAIRDRNGIDLAITQSAFDVAVDPYLIKDPQAVAALLAPRLHRTPAQLLPGLTKPHSGFVYIAHQVPGDEAAAIGKLRIAGRQIDGISFVPQVKRVYPRGTAASQVLGFVGWGNKGLSGIESRYDGALRGQDGLRRIVNDAIGQPIAVTDLRTTAPGRPLRLTLDAGLQSEVEQVLRGVGFQYQPCSASAIAMDPNTGAILALANWPERRSVSLVGGSPCLSEDRAVSFNYEPGSTFKAITVAGALEAGLVTPDTQFNVPAVLQVADRQIHDAEAHGNETLTVADILKKSSNIGADLIGMKLGATQFDYWVHRFGFGKRTGVDLPGEESGIVLHAPQYSGSSMGNLPIGQGESVTPIQMATAYSAIANGGILRPPHIVSAVGGRSVPLPAGHRILSAGAAASLRTMLQGVLADGGTASGAAIPGYEMAGKTGTANEVIGGKYSSTAYAASFIGMVPARAPKLVIAVMVDRPSGAIYGGSVAAPAYQKIVGWAVPYLGIYPR